MPLHHNRNHQAFGFPQSTPLQYYSGRFAWQAPKPEGRPFHQEYMTRSVPFVPRSSLHEALQQVILGNHLATDRFFLSLRRPINSILVIQTGSLNKNSCHSSNAQSRNLHGLIFMDI